LLIGTLTAWGGPVLAQTAQIGPEDLAAAHALAESGDAKAQSQLGTYYSEGPAGSRDLAKARQWFQKAADQGYAEGQRRLGRLYHFIDPEAHDAEQAARWYALAAGQGDATAQYNLGLLYFVGDGVPVDP